MLFPKHWTFINPDGNTQTLAKYFRFWAMFRQLCLCSSGDYTRGASCDGAKAGWPTAEVAAMASSEALTNPKPRRHSQLDFRWKGAESKKREEEKKGINRIKNWKLRTVNIDLVWSNINIFAFYRVTTDPLLQTPILESYLSGWRVCECLLTTTRVLKSSEYRWV